MSANHGGKGDSPRPVHGDKFRSNYERIFKQSNSMKKMYVWEETSTARGSAFGGTIAVIAESPDDARAKVKEEAKGWEGVHRVDCSDGTSKWDRLEEDLSKEPKTMEVVIAAGGDY